MGRRPSVPVSLAFFLLLPAAASAHAPMEGLDGFLLGMTHPLGEPAQATALVALALALAWSGWSGFRRAMPCYGLGLGAGVALGLAMPEAVDLAIPQLALAALLGAHAAAQESVPERVGEMARTGASERATETVSENTGASVPWRYLLPVLAGAAGLCAGPGQVPDPGPPGDVLVTFAGSLVMLLLAPVVVLGWMDMLLAAPRPRWLLLVPRVFASWVSAVAVLLLALAFA